MQVNLNTNINQTKPSFGKLKAIGFATHAEKSALRGDSGLLARRKLLEICELPIIKKLFDKYDGGIYSPRPICERTKTGLLDCSASKSCLSSHSSCSPEIS